MTSNSAQRPTRLVLLDIEGTTTPITFVHEVLFPYARARLAAWLGAHAASAAGVEIVQRLSAELAHDRAAGARLDGVAQEGDATDPSRAATYASWLMERDRKSPGLKLLQGLIWDEGYRDGQLHGEVFNDVPRALRRWHDLGVAAAIYSSGSVLAQRRLFASTSHGDLTSLIAGFFDTTVGAKVETSSYQRIVSEFRLDPSEVLFVSDVTRELFAARAAGLRVVLCLRPGNPAQGDAEDFDSIRSFDELL